MLLPVDRQWLFVQIVFSQMFFKAGVIDFFEYFEEESCHPKHTDLRSDRLFNRS